MSALRHRPSWTDTDAASPALLSPSRVAGVGIHWLGPAAPARVFHGEEKAIALFLRGIRRFHMSKGWSDIAYQFAVDNEGRRWELRGWRRQSAANGDRHVNETHGAIVALLGLGQTASPAMLDGLRDAVADFRQQYPGARAIKTHNQLRPDPTSCPGPQLTRLVKAGQLDPSRRLPARPAPALEAYEMGTIIRHPNGSAYLLTSRGLVWLDAGDMAGITGTPPTIIKVDGKTWDELRRLYPAGK
jgi:hypothetical protein